MGQVVYARTYVVRTYLRNFPEHTTSICTRIMILSSSQVFGEPLSAAYWPTLKPAARICARPSWRGLCAHTCAGSSRRCLPPCPSLSAPRPPLPDCVRTLRLETAHATYRTYVRICSVLYLPVWADFGHTDCVAFHFLDDIAAFLLRPLSLCFKE